MHRAPFILALAMTGMAGLSGCSHNDDPVRTATTPAVTASDFTAFVSAQYSDKTTTETATSVTLPEAGFTFADDNNTEAFNAIIATAP